MIRVQNLRKHFGPVTAVEDVSFTAADGTSTGVPANGSPANGNSTTNWSDVEIKQVRNVVTLTIDKTAIFAYTNTAVWTNGYLMLGYADPYGGSGGVSVGSPDAAAYFSNLRVVRLTGPVITALELRSPNVVITFTTADGDDTTASFALQAAGTVNSQYADVVPAASFAQLVNGAFQVTCPQNGAVQFYRIRHK